MPAYAHTLQHRLPCEWEPLFTPFGEGDDECQWNSCQKCANLVPYHGHLNKVAWWTAKFAAEMFTADSEESKSAHQWGYLAGLWHDLGKFAPEWQTYLASKADPHTDEIAGKVDHSSAGAVFTHSLAPCGSLMSYLIAGHHAGLPNGTPDLFEQRLNKTINEWRHHAQTAGVPLSETIPPPPLTRTNAGSDAMAFTLRHLFSCLVDADFLATEAFMQPQKSELRHSWPDDIIDQMLDTLAVHLSNKFASSPTTPVNQARETVRLDCENTAANLPGFFSLTVPTGGGKTLSSLLFALRHAKKHNLRRVIYVIPFTSIITQNADVFREAFASLTKALGRDIVLEHHSKFDPSKETAANRLASENWDAPLIVTTNVQFFESLFANRTSACRKLHCTARSVIIFDEVQALPNHLLAPILRGLRCLVHDLHSTAVLCTATQPALEQREDFKIGIPREEITEIIRDPSRLATTLDRVSCKNLGLLDDETLITHILENAPTGCLLILNTTKAAQTLHQKLTTQTHALHLSARMCPRHVMCVLAKAKRLRRQGKPVVLVSTQLVEAGVDISFPVVYRAECGLDSFAQAAGRCNRNGELGTTKGRVFLFQPTDHPIPKSLSDLTANAAITRTQITPNFPDDTLLSLPAIRLYFEHAIWQAGLSTRWDKHHIVSNDMPCFDPASKHLTTYDFKTAAEKFRLIESDTHPVLIPWGPKGWRLAEEIRNLIKQNRAPNRSHYRRAQQFTVQVYGGEWQSLKPLLSFHCDEAFAILDHHQNDYHTHTGLKRPNSCPDPNAFCL
jgi:CRISPR-associated endonuclease/helicase Cas3